MPEKLWKSIKGLTKIDEEISNSYLSHPENKDTG
jgi:hypothetical protein